MVIFLDVLISQIYIRNWRCFRRYSKYSSSNYYIIVFSMITTEFTDDADKYIGWAETAAGMGLTIGPLIGTFLYHFTTYMWTFVIYGTILLVSSLIMFFILPSKTLSN